MAYDPTTLLPAYVPDPAPGKTLELADHDEALHELDRQELRGLKSDFGLTAVAGDPLGYVRMSDAAGKGLWVPAAALGPSLIVNGNHDIWQRVGSGVQTSTTTFNILTSFAADRMFARPVGASITQQRGTTVPNSRSRYSNTLVGASSVTTVDYGQRIPTQLVNTYGLQSLLFTCKVRNESGASFTPNLRIGTPASADDFTTVTNRLDQALQSCADSAWTTVYHVFDPSAYTNIANGMECVLRIPSGSLVAGDIIRIAQFDLRPWATVAALPTYVPPDPSDEFRRALAYYWKSFPIATAPAQNAGTTGAVGATGAANFLAPLTFPVPMRASPTITTFNPSATNTSWRDVSSGADRTATVNYISEYGVTLGHGAGVGVAGTFNVIHLTANAELT